MKSNAFQLYFYLLINQYYDKKMEQENFVWANTGIHLKL